MRTLFLVSTVLLAGDHATAQDGKECFPNRIKYNVCEKAREIQHQAAPSFPMKMSANITITMVAAVGPRMIFYATWHRTKSDMDASLRAGGASMADLEARMSQFTQNSVCSQNVVAAFIRLGGQVQYIYKTEDQYVALSPTVTACPNSN